MKKLRGFERITGYEHVTLPKRKTDWSAGYDIEAAQDVEVLPQQVTLIPTGIKAFMQPDEYLGIHIRSSVAIKQQICLINGQGIIDADYYNNRDNEGHIMIAVFNHAATSVFIAQGMRIAQGIFTPYLKTDDDSVKAIERIGGMGSTGR